MAQNGCALWYASEDMRADKWVVLAAVANNGYAAGANGYAVVQGRARRKIYTGTK